MTLFFKKTLFASTMLAGLSGGFAIAADLQPIQTEPVVPIEVPNVWKFQVTMYGWATALNGDVGIRSLPPVKVNESFGDIFQNLDGAFMGSFYASNGTWSVITDLIWAKIGADATIGPFGGRAKFKQTQTIASGAVGYRLPFGPPNLDISATAGVRYNHLTADVEVSPAIIPITATRDASKSWLDPVVGLSMHYDINDRWFVNALADVGGFNVGSKITAQGFGAVGYRWTKNISSAIGYRVIYTDYEDNGFTYNITQHGLFSSLGISF
jgi:hypothetical protein